MPLLILELEHTVELEVGEFFLSKGALKIDLGEMHLECISYSEIDCRRYRSVETPVVHAWISPGNNAHTSIAHDYREVGVNNKQERAIPVAQHLSPQVGRLGLRRLSGVTIILKVFMGP